MKAARKTRQPREAAGDQGSGDPPQVFSLGDSISLHYGPYLARYTSGFACIECNGDKSAAMANLDVPKGANAGDSSMVLNYLETRCAEPDFHPDLLLVNCGLHDIRVDVNSKQRQISLPKYGENLRQIIDLLGRRGISLAWVRTTHCVESIHNANPRLTFHRFAKDHAEYNALADRIMAETGVPSIDLCGFTQTLGPDDELFCDHVHFHPPVREKQAAFLAGWLASWEKSHFLRSMTVRPSRHVPATRWHRGTSGTPQSPR